MKPVVICADDFGLSPSVNQAILDLTAKGRVTAVSTFTHFSDWTESMAQLRQLIGHVDLGVHLNLSSSRRMKDYEYEIEMQIDRFTQHLHKHPDFIDGHQHLHQLPRVQKVVLRHLKKPSAPIYTRQTSLPPELLSWSYPKTQLIHWLGKSWKKRVVKNNIPTNDYFTGIYDEREIKSQDQMFAQFRFFARALKGKRPIWRVRPGRVDSVLEKRSPITSTRELEYLVLLSDKWAQFLEQSQIDVCRFFDSKSSVDFLKFF